MMISNKIEILNVNESFNVKPNVIIIEASSTKVKVSIQVLFYRYPNFMETGGGLFAGEKNQSHFLAIIFMLFIV